MQRDLKSMVEFKELLKNPSPNLKVPVYTESEDEDKPVNKPKDRITLRQVVDMMNDKFQKLDAKMDAGFKRIDYRIDKLEKDINSKIDDINARLDYNNLKHLPDSK